MPKSWWGKTIQWIYIIGYWAYVILAAIAAWPELGFGAWWSYVAFQAMYAVFWPILIVLELSGFRW